MIKDFIESREFAFWLVVNAVYPLLFEYFQDAFEFDTRVILGWVSMALVLSANIYGVVKFVAYRSIYAWTIGLNLIGTIMTSSLSFLFAIPHIPLVVKSLYMMATQS